MGEKKRVRLSRLGLENLNDQRLRILRSAPGKVLCLCILLSSGGIQSKATETQQICQSYLILGKTMER